jgi:hypothetical protein
MAADLGPSTIGIVGEIGDSSTEQCGPSLRGERGFFKSGVRLLASSSQNSVHLSGALRLRLRLNLLALLVVVSGIHMPQAQLKKLRSLLGQFNR